ncbi:hypothetical protein E4U15_005374 [Claviceps sp. LM218 group G6]|nr:hypothetical protein E4U15_005374 [Claviceps sp. LM218 group G6]
MYWNTRKRAQLVALALNYRPGLDVIAIQEPSGIGRIPPPPIPALAFSNWSYMRVGRQYISTGDTDPKLGPAGQARTGAP